MVKKLRPGLISGVSEPLCCCEYINMHGEKTHILAICCDCEALDETFDKIFKCEPVPDSTLDKLLSVLGDRLRIPTFFGAGAVKIRPDIFTPMFVVPSCLYLATLHPIMTMAVFAFMPCFIVTFHALWRRAYRDAPTNFFYSWGLTSVLSSYVVFQCFVVAFREVLLWEILMVFTMMLIMFYFLYLTRRNPDLQKIVLKPRQGHKRTQSNMPHAKTMKANNSSTSITISEGADMDSSVKWVDSRSATAPWMSLEIKQAKAEHRQAERKWLKEKRTIYRQLFCSCKLKVKALIASAKQMYFKTKITGVIYHH
ncbi:palmitoyltransferase [Elysia marginata]|uniref:Palmitoyltransferase n=1 Tax=Elysia marginata TaxID=1093978 RepID=A0AAV4JIA4_9GAST|nr:palmitoyltransferase [Elysia marginata]